MPVLASSGPAAVTDLAERLVADLNAGRVARQSFGARGVAFEWSAGLPQILATQVSSALVDGLSFTAVRIQPSGTPAAKVARGAAKPAATTITSGQVALQKYAGVATFQTEHHLETDGLVPALANTISSSILMAFDADCAAALGADNGVTASGADWPSAILGGVAAVAGAGGAPGVLAISAADYPQVVQSPGPGYAMSPVDGVPVLFGLRIVIMAGLAAGTAYVLDPSAVLAVENSTSPLAVLDPYSGLSTNDVRLAVEAFMSFIVANPGGVCEVTKTVAGTRGGTSTKSSRSDFALGA